MDFINEIMSFRKETLTMKKHKFTKGDKAVLVEDYLDDNSFAEKGSIGTVTRYDHHLVVFSMPNYLTICPHESALKLASPAA